MSLILRMVGSEYSGMTNMPFITSVQVFILILMGTGRISGQERGELARLSQEFRFRDGIYLDFNQVRENNPVPKSSLLIAEDYNDRDFFMKILNIEEIFYYDNAGNTNVIKSDNVFGFSIDGTLNIKYREWFSRQVLFGAICFFTRNTASETHGRSSGREMEKIKYNSKGSFLIEFESGRILRCNVKNIESIIKKDSALYEDYASLTLKMKKAQMFYFIGKFNEKNPVYLPAD